MAQRVTLIHPMTGGEYVSDSAVETNDLVYGHGYRIKREPDAQPAAGEAAEPARRQQEPQPAPEPASEPEPGTETEHPEQERTPRGVSGTRARR